MSFFGDFFWYKWDRPSGERYPNTRLQINLHWELPQVRSGNHGGWKPLTICQTIVLHQVPNLGSVKMVKLKSCFDVLMKLKCQWKVMMIKDFKDIWRWSSRICLCLTLSRNVFVNVFTRYSPALTMSHFLTGPDHFPQVTSKRPERGGWSPPKPGSRFHSGCSSCSSAWHQDAKLPFLWSRFPWFPQDCPLIYAKNRSCSQ